MKQTGGKKARTNRLCLAVMSILSMTAFSGCAYSMAEVRDIWKEVAVGYPDCKIMPKIITFDDGFLGGFYVKDKHTVVIDKYASDEVWRHEFRHACGDSMGEEPIAMNGTSVYSWIQTYRQHNEWSDNY
jgi:hypothetical protein